MYAKGAELKTGILVVGASLALLGLLYFATGESLWTKWRHVEMRLMAGELAPRVGDGLYVNGVPVGKVELVQLRTEIRRGDDLTPADRAILEARAAVEGTEVEGQVREVYVHVRAKLVEGQVVPAGTKAVISQSVTGLRTLRLVLGPSLEDIPDEATAREPIWIHQAPSLASISDAVGDMLGQASSIVESTESVLTEVHGLVRDMRGKLAEIRVTKILGDLEDTTASFKQAAAGIDETISKVRGRIDDVTNDVARLAAAAASLVETLDKDVPALVNEIRGTVAKADGILTRAGPKIDVFLDDVGRTGKNIVALSEEFAGVGPEARALLSSVGGDVEELVGVLTDVGRNLLDASEDLRSHPWKLMNEPSTDEIAYDNLRLTTQSYVRAMQKMQETARTLREILARRDASDPVVQALVRRTLAEFEASVDRYRTLERRLVDLLRTNAPGAAPPPGAAPQPVLPPRTR